MLFGSNAIVSTPKSLLGNSELVIADSLEIIGVSFALKFNSNMLNKENILLSMFQLWTKGH